MADDDDDDERHIEEKLESCPGSGWVVMEIDRCWMLDWWRIVDTMPSDNIPHFLGLISLWDDSFHFPIPLPRQAILSPSSSSSPFPLGVLIPDLQTPEIQMRVRIWVDGSSLLMLGLLFQFLLFCCRRCSGLCLVGCWIP